MNWESQRDMQRDVEEHRDLYEALAGTPDEQPWEADVLDALLQAQVILDDHDRPGLAREAGALYQLAGAELIGE